MVKTELYTLSIRLSADGFSFSVFSPLNDEGSRMEEYPVDESLSLTANLKRAFREVEWLHNPFRRVNVLMADKRFTLVPLEYFEDEQAEQLFYHNHPKRENEAVLYHIPQGSNTVILFGMDKSACNFLREQYPTARFYAQVCPLIEYFTNRSRRGTNRKLYAHLRPEAIDVFAFEPGHLLLANSFDCRTTPDRLYYLLYIWKQLGLEQEQDEMHLTGDLHDKEQLLTELRKFIRQVFVMNPASNLDFEAITLCE